MRPSGAFVVDNEYSIVWLNSRKRAIETLVKAQSHGWFCFKWIVCLLPWKPNGLPKKKKKGRREEIKTKRGRETPHCKQGMWRAGIHFPFKKVFSLELNNCRPFLLWLSPPLENNPKSELFSDISVSFLMAMLGNCMLSPLACITIQGVRPGLTYYTGFPEFACGHSNTPLPSPTKSSVLTKWRNQTTVFYRIAMETKCLQWNKPDLKKK